MHQVDERMYLVFSSIIGSVRKFCQESKIIEIMPSPVTYNFEFPPSRSLFIGNVNSPELILPASNSFQKQIAAQYFGRVFCFAPCYRREQAWVDGSPLHLQVFHQIEMEILDCDIDSTIELAKSLLNYIVAEFPMNFLKMGKDIFSKIDKIDLLHQDIFLHNIGPYDRWVSSYSKEITNPLWIMHTPQTPLPKLNKDYGDKLSMGFDMILPIGFGELMSGGERDKLQLAKFCYEDQLVESYHKSSGFGIGLERLIAFLLQIADIREIKLPHHK